jgi:integrase
LATVSLAEARELAADARRTVREGKEPLSARASKVGSTFGDLAERYICEHEAGWRNARHKQQWRNTLDTYAKPLAHLPVSDIGTTDVLQVLSPIWKSKTVTASRVRSRIELVLDYAKALRLRSGENPAAWRGNLKMILPAPRKLASVSHLAALPYSDAAIFIATLRGIDGVVARALEFAILTAARRGEVLGATWDEVDLEAKVWCIPARRMKANKQHRVPLCHRATEIIERQRALLRNDLIFPGFKDGRPLSGIVFSTLLRQLGINCTVHGFRSSFRDWAAERTAFQREVVEICLAHAVGTSTERAYARGDLLDKRRAVMDAWADFLAGPVSADVIQLRR